MRRENREGELEAFIAFGAGLLTAALVALPLYGLNALLPVGPGVRQLGYVLVAGCGLAGTIVTYRRLRGFGAREAGTEDQAGTT